MLRHREISDSYLVLFFVCGTRFSHASEITVYNLPFEAAETNQDTALLNKPRNQTIFTMCVYEEQFVVSG
jgi:hypothetical protein